MNLGCFEDGKVILGWCFLFVGGGGGCLMGQRADFILEEVHSIGK